MSVVLSVVRIILYVQIYGECVPVPLIETF